MKNKSLIILIILCIVSIKSYSQHQFEMGYIIDLSGKKIECQIKNYKWEATPKEIEYKLADTQTINKATVETIKEFSLKDTKYISSVLLIDRSSDLLKKLDNERLPSMKEEFLFLRVIVEGKASLYEYKGNNITRFFYNLNDNPINPLVYKRYLLKSDESKIMKNESYKQELLNSLKCDDIDYRDFKRLKYTKEYLVDLFTTYNKSIGAEFKIFKAKSQANLFNLNLRTGMRHTNFKSIDSKYNPHNLGTTTTTRIGIEAEFTLPTSSKKWSIVIEPTYHFYETDINLLEIPISVRRYFQLTDNSDLFLNLTWVFNISLDSEFDLWVPFGHNHAAGLGYKYKDFSLETKYSSTLYLSYDPFLTEASHSVSIIIGYTIF